MAARQCHRERLEEVCCVCHTDDGGVPITPCCQKPAHHECCPAPIHLYQDLRSICMILDLDGYRVSQQPLLIRDAGWCDIQGQAHSVHFTSPITYASLPVKDRRTVNYVYHRVHGLPFDAPPEEKALPLNLAECVIQTVYKTLRSEDQYVVAYKGGTIERDLLTRLHIPHVNLEWFHCPKADQLIWSGFDPGCSCGHHRKTHVHCPKQETYLFYQWLTEHP